MKNVLIFIMLFISTTAFATVTPQPTQTQSQYQGQGQAQGQGQSQLTKVSTRIATKSVSSVRGSGNSSNEITIQGDQREVLSALPVVTQPLPLLNGRIGEMEIKRNIWMRKCGKDDDLVNVVEVNDGGLFSAIRYKDLNGKILSTVRNYRGDSRNLCYWVGYNESSNGGGIGGGATGAMSSGNSFMSMGAAIVPGYNAATFDPKFFIEVDEVIGR